MKDPDKVCLFDLDGTLCDFEGQVRKDLLTMCPASEHDLVLGTTPHDLEDAFPYMKARMDAIKAKPGWWAALPRLCDGFDLLAIAQSVGFDIHILTQGPSRVAAAWAQKMEWYQKNVLPSVPDAAITITRDKGLVYGRVLVDDWPEYVSAWLEHRPRGLVVMPLRPYNKTFAHPQVRHFDGQNVEEIQAAMKAAYER